MSNNQTVKHTPGPWQTGNFDGRSIYDCALDGPVMVAKVSTLGLPAAETKANARLIASAPDLLAALVELRHQLRAHVKFDVKKHYSLMLADVMADKAIIKAKGE